MRIDFVQHIMTETEIGSLIAVEVEETEYNLADALRTATWYILEIDPTVTGKRFADAAALAPTGITAACHEGRKS